MRIGIRLDISSLMLASIVVSAIGVHLLRWRNGGKLLAFACYPPDDEVF